VGRNIQGMGRIEDVMGLLPEGHIMPEFLLSPTNPFMSLTIRPPKTRSTKILLQLSKYMWPENFDFAKSPGDAPSLSESRRRNQS